jgi:hypothetical protein
MKRPRKPVALKTKTALARKVPSRPVAAPALAAFTVPSVISTRKRSGSSHDHGNYADTRRIPIAGPTNNHSEGNGPAMPDVRCRVLISTASCKSADDEQE